MYSFRIAPVLPITRIGQQQQKQMVQDTTKPRSGEGGFLKILNEERENLEKGRK